MMFSCTRFFYSATQCLDIIQQPYLRNILVTITVLTFFSTVPDDSKIHPVRGRRHSAQDPRSKRMMR